MKKLKSNRRNFIKESGLLLTLIFFNSLIKFKDLGAQSRLKPKIVIVGYGVGGATTLTYLLRFFQNFDITIIEESERTQTGPMSNLVISDVIPYEYITHNFNPNKLKNVNFINDYVSRVYPKKKFIKLGQNVKVNYDYLILSPGIGFKNDIDGYNYKKQTSIPHCWNGTKDILRFKKRLNDLEKNSTLIISSPDYPYRCPPAPYERASLIANYLERKKKKSKILILDSKDSFTKKDLFLSEWNNLYKDSIEWVPRSSGGKVVYFDYKNNFVKTSDGTKISGDFINIIPNQKAADLLTKNELNLGKDWCTVNPQTFELEKFEDIFVIGDSIDAGDMPKSAFSANSQAKILALNLINKIFDQELVEPVFLNTCYSFSSPERAFSISAWYRLNAKKDRIVSLGSSKTKVNSDSYEFFDETNQAFGWYDTLIKSIYN